MSVPTAQADTSIRSASAANPLVMSIVFSCALAHLINDLIQSVLPSIYPMLRENYGLTFTQVG